MSPSLRHLANANLSPRCARDAADGCVVVNEIWTHSLGLSGHCIAFTGVLYPLYLCCRRWSADSNSRCNTLIEVFMGRPAGWMQKLTGWGAMRSPGASSLRNEIERLFWVQIATGITSGKAAHAVGVSTAVGTRWFRHRGGMPLCMSNHISGRYLSFAEQEEIVLLRAQSVGVREVARRLGRGPSTIPRELTRNASTHCVRLEYRASVAQWKAKLG